MTSPAQFVRQTKQEISKITWLSRADTLRGSFVVVGVCIILALFLVVVDSFFAFTIGKIIGG